MSPGQKSVIYVNSARRAARAWLGPSGGDCGVCVSLGRRRVALKKKHVPRGGCKVTLERFATCLSGAGLFYGLRRFPANMPILFLLLSRYVDS